MGRGLDVIKDYCRVGESFTYRAWLRRYKGLLPVGESGAWLRRYKGLLPGR